MTVSLLRQIIRSRDRRPPCGCHVLWTDTNRAAGVKEHRCPGGQTWTGRLVAHDLRGTRFLSVEWEVDR